MRTVTPGLAALASLALAAAVLGGEGTPRPTAPGLFAADRCPPGAAQPIPTWPGQGGQVLPGVPFEPGQPSGGATSPGGQGQGQAGQGQTGQGQDQTASNPSQSDFGQAPGAGTGSGGTAAPTMMGDFLRGFIERDIVVFQQTVATKNAAGVLVQSLQSQTIRILVPVGGGASFKVAENDSPRPQDRVFFNYNGYVNVAPEVNHRFGVSPNFHQQTVGFEKTFRDGDASFGVRAPYFEFGDAGGGDLSGFGAVTLTSKFALVNDRGSGNVVSAGLLVTLPTGKTTEDAFGHKLRPVIFTPWLGYLAPSGTDYYSHGYLSLALPTDSADATIFFADFGVGYYWYRGPGLTVVPASEIHVNLPLTHRGLERADGGISVPSSVTLTETVIFRLGETLDFQTGVALPVTGDRPFNWEAIAQLNIRF